MVQQMSVVINILTLSVILEVMKFYIFELSFIFLFSIFLYFILIILIIILGDGDSLLFKFLYDPETDFLTLDKLLVEVKAFTFLVENFLKKLKERECVFHDF